MRAEDAQKTIEALDAAIKADDDKLILSCLTAIGVDVIVNISSIADSLKTLAYVEHMRAKKEGIV